MRHLRTDRRGIPVPFVNLWGPDDEGIAIEHDLNVDGPAIFQHDYQQTVPDFTKQNMQRQRLSMVAGLCQVCARPVPWSRRFLVVSSMSVETVEVPMLGKVAVVTEPWLDRFCAEFAIERCPGIIRRAKAEDLTLVPIRSQRETTLVVSRGWIEGPLEEESRRVQPFMWAKLYLPAHRITSR